MGIHKRFTDDDDEDAGTSKASVRAATERATDPESGTGSSSTQPLNKKDDGSNAKKRGTGGNKGKKAMSSQIRGLERMLRHAHGKMTEKQREEKTKELNQLRRMVKERERRGHEFKSSKKYHMVRFFERRKVERLLEKEKDEEKRKTLVMDLYYVKNFPKQRKYIALFPKGGHSAESRAKVDAIRREIGQGDGQQGEDKRQTDGNDENGDDSGGHGKDGDDGGGKQNGADTEDDFFLS